MVFTIMNAMLPTLDGLSVHALMLIPIGAATADATIVASAGTLGVTPSGPTEDLGFYTDTLTSFTPNADGETLSITFTFTESGDTFATLSDLLLILFLKT